MELRYEEDGAIDLTRDSDDDESVSEAPTPSRPAADRPSAHDASNGGGVPSGAFRPVSALLKERDANVGDWDDDFLRGAANGDDVPTTKGGKLVARQPTHAGDDDQPGGGIARRRPPQKKEEATTTTTTVKKGSSTTIKHNTKGDKHALRRERRERDAKQRSGELALPTPVIEFDAAKAARMTTTVRCGYTVYLPQGRQPYRSQFQVMDAALRAMASERSALLESPTGTGKTFAALAACLAWQRATRATRPTRLVWVARTHDQLSHAVREYRERCAERPVMSLRLSRERFCLHPNIATAPNKAEACEEATKIPNNLDKRGRFDQRNSGCAHLDKAESIGYPQSSRWRKHFRVGGAMATWDIEEAIAEGERMTVCPFHMAQDQIADGAALIFVTYQQLVEPITRRAGGLEQVYEDAVVVVDEAHNLPQVARDAASYRITEARLVHLVETLREFLPHLAQHTKHAEAHRMLASLVADADIEPPPKKKKKASKLLFERTPDGGPLVSLLTWLRRATRRDAPDPAPLSPPAKTTAADTHTTTADAASEERIWDGASAATLVRDVVGLTSAERVDDNCKVLWKLRKTLIEEGLESGAVRSDTINDLEAVLVKLRYLLDADAARHYRLIARGARRRRVPPTRGGRRRGDDREAPTTSAASAHDDDDDASASVEFVCLSASVAMRTLTRGQRSAGLGEAAYLRPARSLLLLSGTLRPFDLLATELGLERVDDALDLVERKTVAVRTTTAFSDGDQAAAPVVELSTTPEKPTSRAYLASAVSATHLSTIEANLLPVHLAVASGTRLDASYNNATRDPDAPTTHAYFDALGVALLGVATAAPHGVLVFFKSYKLLELVVAHWKKKTPTQPHGQTSFFDDRLARAKPVFVEERHLSGDAFEALVRDYRAHAERSARGAVLLAVMRGRAAEGADFKDRAARVVAVVGVPYPPFYDAATRLKREHDDAAHGPGAGDRWYAAEAYRNVNQAAGRLIRHAGDFGALVLLDAALRPHRELMSEWYAARLVTLPGATELHRRLRAFFEAKGEKLVPGSAVELPPQQRRRSTTTAQGGGGGGGGQGRPPRPPPRRPPSAAAPQW